MYQLLSHLQSIAFDGVFVDPITSRVYHVERRNEEMRRYVIVDTATNKDIIPSPYNTRTGVHEHWCAAAIAYDGTVYFSNFGDNRVYSVREGSSPEPITPGKYQQVEGSASHCLQPSNNFLR
jgi:hypothetical protein